MKNYCLSLLFISFGYITLGQTVTINTSKDSLYVSDNFAIPDGLLTNDNGNTGTGWNGNWTYANGGLEGISVKDEYIFNTKGQLITSRNLKNSIKFSGTTFYLSFLVKKNSSGKFRITGNRASDGLDRFGIHIDDEGKLGAQAGTDYYGTVFSSESMIADNETYLVIAKYFYTNKSNINISVYSKNENVSELEPEIWDLEVTGKPTGIVGIDYFNMIFSTTSTNIDDFKLGDTWQSVRDTPITSGFPNTITSPRSSDVYQVDQASTTATKSWTYTTEEAGNYQLGNAWIWVEGTNNNSVDLEVKVGSEIVKKFTAKPEIAPYRFETRLENLAKDETIQITATPSNGAAYKINYRLAYATPTFENLTVFDVASYGAIGNGSDNDYQAIKDACNAAVANGGGLVKFNSSKRYYVRGPQGYILFDFRGMSNIKIEGNGSTIVLHPDGTFLHIDSAENILIDGFRTTYAPLPYFQGDILNINVPGLYLDMQVDERYEAPLTGKYIASQERFGRSFWKTIAGTNMGDGRHLGVDSTAQIGDDSHHIRVFFKDHETDDLQHSKNKNAETFIAPHRDFSHAVDYRESYYATIVRSSRVKISNISTYSVCHFAYHVGNNYGPITFTNTNMLVPNLADKHVAWRDGWHVWGNRYGIMIEDGDFDAGYMYDDVFSPHVAVPKVIEVTDKTILLKTKSGESWVKYTDKRLWLLGDLVSFWNENQTVFQGMGRITAVNDGGTASSISITVDSISNLVEVGSFAINEENINRDMVIRNCTTTPSGRITAVRQRTPILYENCDFKSIFFYIYMGEPYRMRPRNIVFKNSTIFERENFTIHDTWNIILKNTQIASNAIQTINSPRIILDNSDVHRINVRASSKVFSFGEASNTNPITKDSSSTINLNEPSDYPSYAPPFLYGNEAILSVIKTNAKDQNELHVFQEENGITVRVPEVNGTLKIYTINGVKIYSKIILENLFYISNTVLNNYRHLKIISYELNGKTYRIKAF